MSIFSKLAVPAAFAAVLSAAQPAAAQVVTCANCSTIYDQLLQYAKEAQSYETQLSQYGTQLRQYANMLQNTVALPQMVWANAEGDIMRVRGVMNAAQMLGGNAGGFTMQLGQISGFANQITSLPTMANQYQVWANVTGRDVTRLQTALGIQQTQQANDAQILAALEAHSQSAEGQMQAIQAGNEMAALGVKQTQQLQVLLMQQEQVIQDHYAVEADRQAAGDQALSQFLSEAPLPTSGGATY